MPTRLSRSSPPRARADAAARDHSADWLGVWALSMGFAAVVMALIADFTAGDKMGATLILVGAAILIAIVLRATARHDATTGD